MVRGFSDCIITVKLSRLLLKYVCSICLGALVVTSSANTLAQEMKSDMTLGEPLRYEEGGFHRGVTELNASAGAGFGMAVITSSRTHDWWLAAVQYGWIFTDVVGSNHWFRGNWELVGQVFGGQQFYPSTSYIVGAGPLLRYNFAASRRCIPFIDAGAGAAATDIRDGDLSTTWEFNVQGGAGARYFLRENLAVTLQYRFIHISNAGFKYPNLGVNNSTFLAGISWFF
jgi:opacity protein-like surface antigen